jgi:hypothetical protein
MYVLSYIFSLLVQICRNRTRNLKSAKLTLSLPKGPWLCTITYTFMNGNEHIVTWCLKAATSRNRQVLWRPLLLDKHDRWTAGGSFYVACPKVINGHGSQRPQSQNCPTERAILGVVVQLPKLRQKNMVTSPTWSGTTTYCAGESQKQFIQLSNKNAEGQTWR